MAIIELPIKASYVPAWSTWEAIRELIQNAIDEEETSGNPMEVLHDEDRVLFIENPGADFDRRVLLLGETSKIEGGSSRGQFGEGLNLALLAGVRAGLEIVIDTPAERWMPVIERSDEYGEEVLKIRTRKHRKKRDGVRVTIKGIDHKTWKTLKKLFLFLEPPLEGQSVTISQGTILLGSEFAGMVYVKGIFVFKHKDLKFGYDLSRAKLDRDRRMVDEWDLKWRLSQMFGDAAAARPDLMTKTVYGLLRDNAPDVSGLDTYHTTTETREKLAAEFQSEHGDKSIPVSSIAQSQALDHVGRRGIVVPDPLRKLLEDVIGTPDSIQRELATEKTATYAWGDLDEVEQGNLVEMSMLVDTAATKLLGYPRESPIMERTDVVDFHSGALEGICDLESGRLQLARLILRDRRRLLALIVHEESHSMSRAADGTKDFDDTLQDLWSHVAMFLLEHGEVPV